MSKSENSLNNSDDKDRQNRLIVAYLSNKDASRNEIAFVLGIRINSVTWRVHDLMKNQRVAVYKIGKCQYSNIPVELLTSNPEKFQSQAQFSLW
ncbi:MAG: hypothetical protein RIC03_05620 [Cyclobacteriaceae bacterium]